MGNEYCVFLQVGERETVYYEGFTGPHSRVLHIAVKVRGDLASYPGECFSGCSKSFLSTQRLRESWQDYPDVYCKHCVKHHERHHAIL